jgi:hypothetical protein
MTLAYQLVTAPSTQESVMTSLRDFAVANGWTLNNFTAASIGVTRGVMSLNRGDCYVSFRWEGTESESLKSIAMYQALGYSAPNAATPWLQADDSGNGTTGDSLSNNRRVAGIGSGPFTSLHLFAFDTDQISTNTAPTVYCVLEYQPGKYRHFGFGNLDKIGDWTGGEWVGGHEWDTGGTNESNPIDAAHSVLLDGLGDDSEGSDFDMATLHVEGLPGQSGLSKWSLVWDDNSPADDRGGNPRVNCIGPIRGNAYTRLFARFVPSSLDTFIPLMPSPVMYRRDTTTSNSRLYALGYMPNVRMVQMRAFNPGQEIVIGSVTWKVFPVVAKSNVGGDNEESENMGIAYIKEVA